MPTSTPHLALHKFTDGDPYVTELYAENWQTLDDYPGYFPCTSSTRPAWAAAQTGMLIVETDTKLLWLWDGAAFVRFYGKGLLAAPGTRTTAFGTASTTYGTVVSCAVTVPAGSRRVLVAVECRGVQNTNGITELAIFRDATQITGPHRVYGGTGATAAEQPPPYSYSTLDNPSAGAKTYTLQARVDTTILGTSTLLASATAPTQISVIEV